MSAKHRKKRWFTKETMPLHFMALPVVFYLLVFCYTPMLGLVMAFQDLNISRGVFSSPFVGFRNFEFLFSSTDAFIITRNTVCYNLVFIAVNISLAVIMSLMLNELRCKRYGKVLQTVYMLPYFLSITVVAIIVEAFLARTHGLVNETIRFFGGAGKTNWYMKRSFWPPFLVFVNAWKGVGYSTVLYLAVISGISTEYYEAAVLDGATRWQQARYITLPHLRFVVSISLIMAMGGIFRGDFGLFYTVTKDTGKLYPVTDVIDTYIYRGLTTMSNVGMSTAAGLYQSVVGFFLVLLCNRVVSKIDPDSAMF